MRLYIIRHGQTAWNKKEIFRGTRDIPLNEVGLKEASALGHYLHETRFDVLYTSPLSRARQTADAVARYQDLAPLLEPLLTDLNFGVWQGRLHEKVKQEYPELYQTWVTAPEQTHFPEGESLQDVLNHADTLLANLRKSHPGKTVGLFTHRVVCKVLICRLLGLGLEHFWQIEQSTACLNKFRLTRSTWVCEALNSQCHLTPLATMRTTADF
jgi:broad specificity phosphatase PhoE